MKNKNMMERRGFLKTSAAGFLGMGVATGRGLEPSGQNETKTPKVKDYRVLGRTEFKVSDIGGGYIQEPGLIAAMLDTGVNFIDTAEQYPGHHRIVSEAIEGRDRKSFFINSKLEIKEEDVSKEGFLKRTRKCLEDLKSDYIDCMMMHCPEKLTLVKTEGFHAAMDELKKEGRIRFVGMSHHGSFWLKAPEETMENMLMAAADDGRYDVFLMAYNFLQMDASGRILEVCKEKKIGTALMKTTPVAKYTNIKARIEQMEEEGKDIHPLMQSGMDNYKSIAERAEGFIKEHHLENPEEIKEASIRFVLDSPNVNTVCCSMKTFDELERFVRLSGTKLSDWDKAKLALFKEGCGQLYCRHACGLCEPKCPHQVPVNAIMRYNHYFEAQGKEKYAMSRYQAILGAKADVCRDCRGVCEKACPYGVPIQGMLAMAHYQLSLD
jgi:predicted aldo/keto reductase-like oxidoreductase